MKRLVLKSPIIENILHWAKAKADQQIKKTDGSKRNRYESFCFLRGCYSHVLGSPVWQSFLTLTTRALDTAKTAP